MSIKDLINRTETDQKQSELLDKLTEAKSILVTRVSKALEDPFLEPKVLRDLTAIVISLEGSLTSTTSPEEALAQFLAKYKEDDV